jgi:RNA polymerase sigma factor (sigma-70 family)
LLCIVRVVKLDQLIRRAQTGDREAVDELGCWLNAKLSRFFGNCFETDVASELVQDSIVVILKQLHAFEFERPDSFNRYLMKVAAIQAKSRRREGHRAWRRQTKLEAIVHVPDLSPPSRVLAKERRELMIRWIPRLPDVLRRALEHELAGGDDESLAQRENISLTTARTRRFRARKRLQILIEQAGVTPAPPTI